MQRFCEDCGKETIHDYDVVVNQNNGTKSNIYICKECGHVDLDVGPVEYEDLIREG